MLLAVVASMYAVYHGPEGLRRIARRTHDHASRIAAALRAGGVEVVNDTWFDTLTVPVPGRAGEVVAAARSVGLHLRLDRRGPRRALHLRAHQPLDASPPCCAPSGCRPATDEDVASGLPEPLRRTTDFLTHEVFNSHHSETQMLRYLHRLSSRDYALDRGMIPLGSCTMKLNATTEMEPISLPGFADLHPFAPAQDATGYRELVDDVEGVAGRGHRLRQGLGAAQRRLAGRARRAAGDPRLPPRQRRHRRATSA